MDQADEKYFEEMFALFRTKGWKRLVAELEETSAALNDLTRYKDMENVFFAKGQDSTLQDIITLADRTQEAYELATKEDETEETGSDFGYEDAHR